MKFVVVPAVLEFLSDPLTHNDAPVFRVHSQIATIKELVVPHQIHRELEEPREEASTGDEVIG